MKTKDQCVKACEYLLADGWVECRNQFKPHSRCFYKRFDTPTRCSGNQDKPGAQIEIAVSRDYPELGIELELRAGLKDETWLSMLNYSLPKDIKAVVALIPRMLAIWEAANEFGKE